MKRISGAVCIVIIVAFVLTACVNPQDTTQQARNVLDLLSENRIDEAKAYLSPLVADGSIEGLQQIAQLLQGRKIEKMIRTHTYSGYKVGEEFTGTEEQAVYELTFNDGITGQLQTVYYSGQGFVSFYVNINVPTSEDTGTSI